MSGEGVISPLTVDHGQAEMMVGSDVFGLRAVLGGQLQGILIGPLGLAQAPQAHQQVGYTKGAGNHEDVIAQLGHALHPITKRPDGRLQVAAGPVGDTPT